jgi:hypothetical protein
MANITVTKANQASGMGNLAVVTASCASIATGSTWVTGLSKVNQLFVSGMGEAMAYTYTESSGTVTFTVTAGPLTTVDLMAVGEP